MDARRRGGSWAGEPRYDAAETLRQTVAGAREKGLLD